MFWTNYVKYCEMLGKSPNAVAEAAKAVKSSGSVTGWRNGAMPRSTSLVALANYFTSNGIPCTPEDLLSDGSNAETPDWLKEFAKKFSALDSHGKQLVDLVLTAEYERCTALEIEKDNIVDLGTIRHYLYSPAAGTNGLISGEDYEDIPRTPDMPESADFCLTVSGDSMEPYIMDGQMVFVKETAPINDFDVGVFFYDGSTYVKQYCPSYDGSVYLLSANPKREDANITVKRDSASSLVCFGKVILPKKLPRPIYN